MNKTTLAYFTIEDNYSVFTRTNYFDDNTKSIERAKAEKELARLQAINTNRHLKIVTRYDVITMQEEGGSLLFCSFVLNRTPGLSPKYYTTLDRTLSRENLHKFTSFFNPEIVQFFYKKLLTFVV